MATQIPYQRNTTAIRDYTASATVTGGQLVEFTGDKAVGPAGANSVLVAGWVPYDGVSGDSLPVHQSGVVPCQASGSIAAGQRVVAAAGGQVAGIAAPAGTYAAADTTASRAIVGYAEAAITNGSFGPIRLALA